MRLIALFLFFAVQGISAQTLTGKVSDRHTGLAIPHAQIFYNGKLSTSSAKGYFYLPQAQYGDTLQVSAPFYKTQKLVIPNTRTHLTIELDNDHIVIQEVVVHPKGKLREDLVVQPIKPEIRLDGKKPTWQKIFITKFNGRTPLYKNRAPNSTASLISIDVLSLIGILRKNKADEIQQTLHGQEKERFVEEHFAADQVQQMTGLTGDSLQYFMRVYKPLPEDIEQMTTYHILLYIKTKYHEYKGITP